MDTCEYCEYLWTKWCPYRTRVEATDRKYEDPACESFVKSSAATFKANHPK